MTYKKYLSLILIFFSLSLNSSWAEIGAPATDQDIAEYQSELLDLQDRADSRWEELYENQNTPEWVKEQDELGLAGMVYSKGFLNPRVSRRLMPDQQEGWLAVDTVSLGPSLIQQLTTLTANVLFNHYVMPGLQAGVINEQSFVNVRHYPTYKDALLADPFSFENVPMDRDGFSKMQDGEVFSTVTTGGVFVRYGGSLLDLLGISIPVYVNIGPRAKLTVKQSLKISISKAEDDIVYLNIEKAKDIGKGFGIGFGIFFDDIIDIPVAIGINSMNGYSPLIFNIKRNDKKLKSLMYKIDMKTVNGQKAYRAFLNKDFSELEMLASDENDESVTLEMIKEGDIHTREVNAAVDLIIWRVGYRNIFREGRFTTMVRGSKRFDYVEISKQSVHDRKWLSNYETFSDKVSVLVPLNHDQTGFVVDTHIFYTDTKTYGEELMGLSGDLENRGTGLGLPITVNNGHNYGKTQVDVKVRFTSLGLKKIIEAEEEDLWIAAGLAVGLPDPYQIMTDIDREDFVRRARSRDIKRKRQRAIDRAEDIVQALTKIQNEPKMEAKSRIVLNELKGSTADGLHKAMMDLAGLNNLIVQGIIRGRGF
ncbi:MAG: hypothetical protein KC493_09725 [Bacteriovoracaceae bacterium]|nr:hypothetical protein [Bacteriovoracaceae bacterium]